MDGLEGIEAAYEFAGMVGLDPRGRSLEDLWLMARGKRRMMRELAFHTVALDNNRNIPLELFLSKGIIADAAQVPMDPRLAAKVQAILDKAKATGRFVVEG